MTLIVKNNKDFSVCGEYEIIAMQDSQIDPSYPHVPVFQQKFKTVVYEPTTNELVSSYHRITHHLTPQKNLEWRLSQVFIPNDCTEPSEEVKLALNSVFVFFLIESQK